MKKGVNDESLHKGKGQHAFLRERCCSGETALSQRVLRPQPLVTITTTEHDLETTAALRTD